MSLLDRIVDATTGVDTDGTESIENTDAVDWRARAFESLQKTGDSSMYYCERCNRLYSVFSPFYDHRVAVEGRAEGDVDFEDYQELQPGETIPAGAEIGSDRPCFPPGGEQA